MGKMQLFLNMSQEKPDRWNSKTPKGRTHSHWNFTRWRTTTTITHICLFSSHTFPHTPQPKHAWNTPQIHTLTQRNTNTTTHTHVHCHTSTGAHKLLWGMLLEKLKTGEPLRIPFGTATCQVLDWNKVKCSLQLKRSQRNSNRQAVRTTYRWTSFPQTPTTAHESLAGKSVNLKSCSVRFGYIHIPFQHRQFKRWINKSCWVQQMTGESDTCQSKRPWFISWSDGTYEWNWPFTRGGQLLTLRERGSSPLAWLDEYKLTYSPSPPSSFALSLYGKRGGTQNRGVKQRRGAQSIL